MNTQMNQNQTKKSNTNTNRPLQNLQKNGHKLMKDNEGNVIVGVGKSLNPFEGVYGSRESSDGLELMSIPEESITDYNSLWEITSSGWNTDQSIGECIYPYVNVNNDWYRWDEKMFLRTNCKTLEWSKDNRQKYIMSMFTNQQQTPFINTKKVGRNQPCICGSGKKYKKCCGGLS